MIGFEELYSPTHAANDDDAPFMRSRAQEVKMKIRQASPSDARGIHETVQIRMARTTDIQAIQTLYGELDRHHVDVL